MFTTNKIWRISGMLLVLLVGMGLISAEYTPQTSANQPAPQLNPENVIIDIHDTPQRTDVKRLGVNLGARSQFAASQHLKNLIPNPGFESGEFAMIINADPDATDTRFQADFWQPQSWNNDALGIGHPVDFWDNATYEIISGDAKWRTGTVTDFTHDDDRYTFYLGDSGTPPDDDDAIIVRKQIPGYEANRYPTAIGEPNDTRPGSPGTQSLRLKPATFSYTPSFSENFDSFHRDADWNAGKLLVADGDWHMEIWAKATNPGDTLRIQFRRIGEATFYDETISLGTSWQHIVRDFNVPVGTDANPTPDPNIAQNALGFELFINSAGSDVLVDDVILEKASANPTVFTDTLVNRLTELNPGIIRNWGDQLGSSLDTQLATQFGRKSTGFSPETRFPSKYHVGLHDFLLLAETVGSEPWYVIPPTFTQSDLQNLAAYLSAPAGSHPYADLRANLGHPIPWTDTFTTIHLEFGNEIWGTNGENFVDPFMGATVRGGIRAGQVAHDRLGVYKSSPHFVEPKINFVIGGQANFAFRQFEIDSNSQNHDQIGIAPYFGRLDDAYGSEAERYYPLYAHSLQATSSSVVTEAQDLLEDVGQGTELAVYEINLHAITGDVPLDVRNDFLAGQGAAIAVPLTMLHYQQDLGINNILAYRMSQFSTKMTAPMTNGDYARVWGLMRDLEGTGRKRPTFLATELANSAIKGDLVTANHINTPIQSVPAVNGNTAPYNLPLIQTFVYKDGNSYSAVVFNLDLFAPHDVQFSLPTNPVGSATWDILSAPSLETSNENGQNVAIASVPLGSLTNGQTFSMPPHSMAVLSWTSDGTPANRLPLAYDDSVTAFADEATTIAVLSNDFDLDGNTLTPTIVTPPTNGTATVNADGTVTYTPNAGYLGPDSFEYTVFDGVNTSNVALVTINVVDAPTGRIYLPLLHKEP